jgi:RES domain-containing protein
LGRLYSTSTIGISSGKILIGTSIPERYQVAGHGEKLSRLQETAISALLTAPSVPEAAKMVGVGERTLWRWMRLPGFKEAYQAARRELVRHAIVTVQGVMSQAVKTLVEIMENSDSPASARVSSAKTILELGVRAVEMEDLEARISKLETLTNAA